MEFPPVAGEAEGQRRGGGPNCRKGKGCAFNLEIENIPIPALEMEGFRKRGSQSALSSCDAMRCAEGGTVSLVVWALPPGGVLAVEPASGPCPQRPDRLLAPAALLALWPPDWPPGTWHSPGQFFPATHDVVPPNAHPAICISPFSPSTRPSVTFPFSILHDHDPPSTH